MLVFRLNDHEATGMRPLTRADPSEGVAHAYAVLHRPANQISPFGAPLTELPPRRDDLARYGAAATGSRSALTITVDRHAPFWNEPCLLRTNTR